MIHRAKFRNFKALRDVEVTFDSRLTVLVGPNGCGKTSILQGLHFLTQLATGQEKKAESVVHSLHEYCTISSPLEELGLRLEGVRVRKQSYKVEIQSSTPTTLRCELAVNMTDGTAAWQWGNSRDNDRWSWGGRYLVPTNEANLFDHTAFVRFSTGRLAVPTLLRAEDYPPQVGEDGLGLAATLSHIQRKYPDAFERIRSEFCRVISNARNIRFDDAVTPEGFLAPILLLDFVGVKGVKAAHVSSGTLFALGLLTVALGPDSANSILLDDIDHGLHPKAQLELIKVFRGLIDGNPDLQIIATTHSPYILDRLEPNEVRVATLGDDGAAIVAKLEDHPDFERWNETMSPGEFWSHVGEQWAKKVARKEPSPVSP